ncbi:MAG: hypothetical protein U0R17_04755 [Acidimicrobiia bacterium]
MDVSHIKAACRFVDHYVAINSDHSRLLNMISAGSGDRQFKVIFDYYIYEGFGLEKYIEEIDQFAVKYGIDEISYSSFAPHEKIPSLQEKHTGVEFIPRSKFFLNIGEHLV